MTAGQCVITDECQAAGIEAVAAQAEDFRLEAGGNPRIESMGDDVIEFSPVGVDFGEVALNEANISEAEVSDHALAPGDGEGGEVNADELAASEALGHWDEVAAVAATEFQDAAGVGAGGGEAEKVTDYPEPAGMGLCVGITRVGHEIVGGGRQGVWLHKNGVGLPAGARR